MRIPFLLTAVDIDILFCTRNNPNPLLLSEVECTNVDKFNLSSQVYFRGLVSMCKLAVRLGKILNDAHSSEVGNAQNSWLSVQLCGSYMIAHCHDLSSARPFTEGCLSLNVQTGVV
jgi:hypothetical protein